MNKQGLSLSSSTAPLFFSCAVDDMDLAAIHTFLRTAYWSQGIERKTVERAIRHSLCIGVFTEQNTQIAFARAISDNTTFAYLADVFVLPEFRGKGISKAMLSTFLSQPELQGLRRILLATRDAHALYESFSFKPLATPEIFMEKHEPDIYLRDA